MTMRVNDLLKYANVKEKPELVMVFYSHYAEAATFDESNKIGAFRPIRKDVLARLKTLTNENIKFTRFHGIVPEDVVWFSFDTFNLELMWKSKKKERMVYLDDGETKVIFPNILFYLRENELSVYFYKRWRGKDTILYKYSLANALGSSKVCLGSMKFKSNKIEDIIKEYEKLFFYSTFTTSIKSFKESINKIFDNGKTTFGEIIPARY